jgi:hypothetical protein
VQAVVAHRTTGRASYNRSHTVQQVVIRTRSRGHVLQVVRVVQQGRRSHRGGRICGCTTGKSFLGRFAGRGFDLPGLLLIVFFFVGHFSDKGAPLCFDIILMKSIFEGQKSLC